MILSNKRAFDLVITLIISLFYINNFFITFFFSYLVIGQFFVQKRIVSLGKEKNC